MRMKKPPSPRGGYFALAGALALFALYYFVAGGPGARDSQKPLQRHAVSSESLPYEEKLSPSPEEAVRQTDYAILQTMARLEMPPGQLKVLEEEPREYRASGLGSSDWEDAGQTGSDQNLFSYKKVRIHVGPSIPLFIEALNESLLAWGWKTGIARDLGAKPSVPGEEMWYILAGDVPTHALLLMPGFTKGGEGREVSPGGSLDSAGFERGPARRRKAGEIPLLCIVIDDIGANMEAVRSLLALEFPVTFSVWPYSPHAREAANAAHAAGREVMLHQPMEPVGYPSVKPGPGVLLASMSPDERRALLRESLGKVPHISGINNHMGSSLTQNGNIMREVSQELSGKNLFVLDSLTHPRSRFQREASAVKLAAYRRDVFLDVEADRNYVLRQLRQAEKLALLTGQAVAIGHPLAETLAALRQWQEQRDKTVRIVPLKTLTPEPVGK